MGQLIPFPLNRNQIQERIINPDIHAAEIELARSLVSRAAQILSVVGGNTERVSWMLEECCEMLGNGDPSCYYLETEEG